MSKDTGKGLSPSSIPEILDELRAGKAIVLADSLEQESVGDLVCAAEKVSPRLLNFMCRRAGGLLGLTLTAEKCDELHLLPPVEESEAGRTPLTMTIDARRNVKTGLSATDRATTIQAAIADGARSTDLTRPGHVHALRSRSGGVLARAGTTEASVDLSRLAGLKPAGVTCAIMDEDGELARGPQLFAFAEEQGLKIAAITDLIAHRVRSEDLVERVGSTEVQNPHGTFRLLSYYSLVDRQAYYVLCKGEVGSAQRRRGNRHLDRPILVRVHSECLTGDVFHSRRCDCGEQLASALQMIEKEGEGALVYLRQEGRGIGLLNKLRAYKLQEHGRDTVEANEELGLPADGRDYGIGWQILRDIGVRKLRLVTDNPAKVYGLEAYGLEICERVTLPVLPNESNLRYLTTKKHKMGHLYEL